MQTISKYQVDKLMGLCHSTFRGSNLDFNKPSFSKIIFIKEKNMNSDCIEIRDISFEQAKNEIAMFFKEHDGEEYYPSDLMEILGIEYDIVSQVCDELESEGKIK